MNKQRKIYNIEEIKRLYEAGMASIRTLALLNGIPYSTLRRHLKKVEAKRIKKSK